MSTLRPIACSASNRQASWSSPVATRKRSGGPLRKSGRTDEFQRASRYQRQGRYVAALQIQEEEMLPLKGKTMVVIGGSGGVGREVVEHGVRNGARVLAVARHEAGLRQLAVDVRGVETLALDATEPSAPTTVFDVLKPDILVLCAGATPPAAPLPQQRWPVC